MLHQLRFCNLTRKTRDPDYEGLKTLFSKNIFYLII
jgi:hypothetical protein